jgi:hypothetical protein
MMMKCSPIATCPYLIKERERENKERTHRERTPQRENTTEREKEIKKSQYK